MRSFIWIALVIACACVPDGDDSRISEGEDPDDPSGSDDPSKLPEDTPDEVPGASDEAPPNPHCTVADDVVDDLEGTPPLIPTRGGRQGAWYTYNDGSLGWQSPMPPDEVFAPTTETAARGLHAARMQGGDFTGWGAGIGLDLNNHACPVDDDGVSLDPSCPENGRRMPYDLSRSTGVSFYGRSLEAPILVQFKVPSLHDTPDDAGGACDPKGLEKCEDAYFVTLDFTGAWTLYEVPFIDLAQGGWGKAFPWDSEAALGFQWQVPGQGTFDVAIDEICLMP